MARLAHGHLGSRAFSRPGCPVSRSGACASSHNLQKRSVRRWATSDNESDVDPQSGELYSNPQTRYPKPDSAIEAGGLTWAYRTATPPEGADTEAKIPVLLLHGIGSHSYCYRDLARLLAAKGHSVFAPDWPGHGASSKPESGFAYDGDAYSDALTEFTKAVGLSGQPYAVLTSGFILGQYALLWALSQKEDIAGLVMLGVPLGQRTPLRPELAAFKSRLPFRRPKPDTKFAGDMFNANGLAYVMAGKDAQIYDRPYQEEPAANAAIHSIMEKVDWQQLLKTLDERYERWRTPTLVLYGNKDGLLDVKEASQWLETKRTNMKLSNVEGKLGHMPQEDFAEAIAPLITDFLTGKSQAVEGFKRFKKTDYYGAPETESFTGDYVEQ